MRVIRPPHLNPSLWSVEVTHSCGAVLEVCADDLEADKCKKPGTAWWDGSAEVAGLVTKYFLKSSSRCPCGKAFEVEEGLIPDRVKARLRAEMT